MADLKVASLNVHGMRNTKKRKGLIRLFKEKKFDIICLQETYISQDVSSTWKFEWGGEIFFSEGTNHSQGQVILVRKGIPYSVVPIIKKKRVLAVTVKTDSGDISIYNVYAPNPVVEKIDFFNELQREVAGSLVEKVMVCGDFNSVVNNELDIVSGAAHAQKEVTAFNTFIHSCILNDAWRLSNAEGKEFSWSRNSDWVARRIDYIFISDGIVKKCKQLSRM